jgi:hypothetical protein
MDDVEKVLDDSSGGRGNEADVDGEGREGTLAGFVKEAFGGELLLELFEGKAECAIAERRDGIDDELHLTARFVDADAATGEDLEPILQIETEELGTGAEHDAGELSVSVFEGEVEMAAGRGATVGDFAFDADVEEALFDVAGESGDELADGPGAGSG